MQSGALAAQSPRVPHAPPCIESGPGTQNVPLQWYELGQSAPEAHICVQRPEGIAQCMLTQFTSVVHAEPIGRGPIDCAIGTHAPHSVAVTRLQSSPVPQPLPPAGQHS